jgi:hypothetical protein
MGLLDPSFDPNGFPLLPSAYPLMTGFATAGQQLAPYGSATRVPTSPGVAFGSWASGLLGGTLAGQLQRQQQALEAQQYAKNQQELALNQYNLDYYRNVNSGQNGSDVAPSNRGQALGQSINSALGGGNGRPATGLLASNNPTGVIGTSTVAPVSIDATGTRQPGQLGSTPLPLSYNNPGNIRFNPNNKWVGKITDPNASGGFEQFDTPVNGVRAIDKTLQSYGNQGINTLSGIIGRWSPPSENNTPALITNASNLTGFAPDEPVDLGNPMQRAQVVRALIRQEQGAGSAAYNDDVIHAGINAAGAKPALPVNTKSPALSPLPPSASPVQPVSDGLLSANGQPAQPPSPVGGPFGAPPSLPAMAAAAAARNSLSPSPQGQGSAPAMPVSGSPSISPTPLVPASVQAQQDGYAVPPAMDPITMLQRGQAMLRAPMTNPQGAKFIEEAIELMKLPTYTGVDGRTYVKPGQVQANEQLAYSTASALSLPSSPSIFRWRRSMLNSTC